MRKLECAPRPAHRCASQIEAAAAIMHSNGTGSLAASMNRGVMQGSGCGG